MNQVQVEEEQDQQHMPIPMHFPRPGVDDSVGSLQFQLENDEIIGDVIRTIRREVQMIDERGNVHWVTPPGVKPAMNNLGVGNVITALKSRLTKILSLSDLEEHMILRMVSDLHEDLTDDFYENWEKYDLIDGPTNSMIISMVTDTILGNSNKGKHGNYMKLLRSMHTIQEVGQVRAGAMPQQQPSIQDKITNMFGRRHR